MKNEVTNLPLVLPQQKREGEREATCGVGWGQTSIYLSLIPIRFQFQELTTLNHQILNNGNHKPLCIT